MVNEGQYDPQQRSESLELRMHPNTMPSGQTVADYIEQLARENAELREEVEKHSLREAFAMRALKLIRHYDRSAKGHWKIAKAALDMLADTDLESIDKVDPEILMRAGFGSKLKQENPDA